MPRPGYCAGAGRRFLPSPGDRPLTGAASPPPRRVAAVGENGGMPTTMLAPERPLAIGPLRLAAPVVLAPMAGITNTAFRRLCREYGAGLYVSEMITSRALVERTRESMRLITHHESETPRSVQLYGVDPATVDHQKLDERKCLCVAEPTQRIPRCTARR